MDMQKDRCLQHGLTLFPFSFILLCSPRFRLALSLSFHHIFHLQLALSSVINYSIL